MAVRDVRQSPSHLMARTQLIPRLEAPATTNGDRTPAAEALGCLFGKTKVYRVQIMR